MKCFVKLGIKHLGECTNCQNLRQLDSFFQKIIQCHSSLCLIKVACVFYIMYVRDNKLLRLFECYSRLSGTCKKQFGNCFINTSMNVKQIVNLVNNAFKSYCTEHD